MKKKRLAIVGIVGLPAKYGGFETLVDHFTKIESENFDITVFCEKTIKEERLNAYNNCRLVYLPFKANGGQSIIYDITAIILSWFKFDSILILGTPGSIILPFLKLFKKTHTVINFGGLEWERDKWPILVRRYLKFSEKVAIKNASILVADNQYFCDYISSNYNKDSVLIEYGGDHCSYQPINERHLIKYQFLRSNYDISISRAQADNNLHMVLEAYSKTPERILVLVSNYDKFKYGRDLKLKYDKYPNLYLLSPIYEIALLNILRSNAELYIHSHKYCGTAPSLVEAMSLELPIISYNAITNHFTTEDAAIYFDNSEELIKILEAIDKSKISIIRKKMGEIAKKGILGIVSVNSIQKSFKIQ